MNLLDQIFWLALFRALAVEAGGVVLMALLLDRAIRSAFWRRSLWQATVVCLLLLTASELSGFGRGLAGFAARPRTGPRQEIRPAPMMVSEVSLPPVQNVIPRPRPVAPAVLIWWPGLLWLAGFAVVSGRVAVAQFLFVVLGRGWVQIVDSEFNRRVEAMLGQFGYRRKVRLWQASSMASPIAFGIVRPAIALPPDFAARFGSATQEAVLAHELAHLVAGDPLWYRLADLAGALLWWHPLVWWARRQLHRRCELAADQATAIVPDGPVKLAQCLVSLGRKMTAQRKWGLMGVNGGGFGSNLGERVESLVNLADGAWKPLRSWRVSALKTGGTILLAGLVVCLCGWVEGPSVFAESWHDSAASAIFMAALDTNQSEAPTASPIEKEKFDVATKIQNAKLLYEQGKYTNAEAVLVQVLKQDLSNKTAPYYLDLVKEAILAANARRREAVAKSAIATLEKAWIPPSKIGYTTEARRNILSKLSRIRFNEVH